MFAFVTIKLKRNKNREQRGIKCRFDRQQEIKLQCYI